MVKNGAYRGKLLPSSAYGQTTHRQYVAAVLRCHNSISTKKQITFLEGRVSSDPCIVNNRRSRFVLLEEVMPGLPRPA